MPDMSFWKLINGIKTGKSDTADDFGGSDAPKQKFTYTVEFRFRSGLGIKGSDVMEQMDFGVKTTTRPSPIVNYVDVNYYNFRTKVATRVDYGAITMTFYDDIKNKAHDIFEHYIKTISPIANLNREQASLLDTLGQSPNGSASVGPLNTNRHGIIQSIRITHHTGDTKVHYDYLNPKITTMTLDDLDMTTSEASTITFNFNYDSVNIVKA